MDDFSLDCCFNAVYKALTFRDTTYKKISSPTPRYATQCQCEIQFKIFWSTPRYAVQREIDSMLCGIAQSHDSPLCGIAHSRDSMPQSVKSTHIREYQN
jgi:hypothetical protein